MIKQPPIFITAGYIIVGVHIGEISVGSLKGPDLNLFELEQVN